MEQAGSCLDEMMRVQCQPQFRERAAVCVSNEDPIDDWRGHLALSGYYPCAGFDWRPVQVAGEIETWLYADYAPAGNKNPVARIKSWLIHPPEGLELELIVNSVEPRALSDWAPWPYRADWTTYGRVPVALAATSVAMFARYRRADGRPVRLMYVVGEATATFLAVYGRIPFTPLMLCLIQMGYGLGGGWNRFFDPADPACSLRHAFRAHPAGMSPFILTNDYLPPTEFPVIHVCQANPGGTPLRLRRSHNDFVPSTADLEMLAELFPGFEAWAVDSPPLAQAPGFTPPSGR